MSTPTPRHKLILPDAIENFDVQTFNTNMEMIDKAMPIVLGGGDQAGNPIKIWAGMVLTNTGAGGEKRTEPLATDANGFGGLWFGQQLIPKFDGGISAVFLTQNNTSGNSAFDVIFAVTSYNTTRVKYKAIRPGGGPANGFGALGIHMMVMGW